MAQIVDRLQASGLLKWLGMGEVQTPVRIHPEDLADLLFVEVGEARDAVTVELPDGVCVRLDPHTQNVVGLEILDFSRQFGTAPSTVDEKFVDSLLVRFGSQAQTAYRKNAS